MAYTMDVTLEQIEQAAARISGYVHCTPVLGSALINRAAGCEIRFKCENLQQTGAFKARGAHNAVLSLSPGQRRGGVATHSSGNHAAALALAASRVGISANIVMPDNAPAVKVDAVRAYGGQITFCEATQAAREEALRVLCDRTGACFIPPFDHPDVIAGQGTVALEIAAQLGVPPDVLVTPVGGGGLLAGCAIAGRAMMPDTQIIGAEPAGADDARRSLHSGLWQPQPAPDTVADGLRTSLGKLNFAIIRRKVDDILCAEDAAIIEAMRLVWTRMKLVIEPSSAVGLAAVMAQTELFAGKRVVIVLSGGNVDLVDLPW